MWQNFLCSIRSQYKTDCNLTGKFTETGGHSRPTNKKDFVGPNKEKCKEPIAALFY